MQNTCPNCNRPTRAGAKFCGFCGATLVKAGPIASPPPRKSNGLTCPHCNAPLRPGVKFCASCGKAVSIQTPAKPAVPPAEPSAPATPPGAPPPAPPRSSTPSGRAPAARERRARRSRGRYIIYIGLLAVLCLALAIPAAIFGRPYIEDLLAKETPTSTVTGTVIPAATNTPTLIPSATPTLTTTATTEPSPTPTEISTATYTQVILPTTTSTPQPPLIDADFSQPLDTLWEVWGESCQDRITEDENPALQLNSLDIDSCGVSSRADTISPETGLVISFTFSQPSAEINSGNRQVQFAWTPGLGTPLEWDEPLPLVVLLQSDEITLAVDLGDNTAEGRCSENIEPGIHEIRIEFNDSLQPLLFVNEDAMCESLTISLQSLVLPNGRIHFSGSGRVDDVLVMIER